MKKHTQILALTALALSPTLAAAEVKFGGEAYLGYGNAGDASGALAQLSVFATESFSFGDLGTLEAKVQANLRSDQDDIGYIDDNYVDFSAALDMGPNGKLSVSTFGTLGQKPWADGELRNRGSVAVFPAVPRRYRAIGDKAALIVDGELQKVQEDFQIKYETHFGKLGVEMTADPFQIYGPVYGDDVVTTDGSDRPLGEVKLTYPTAFGIYAFKANDLGDAQIDVVYPVKGTGLVLAASYASNGDDRALYNADLTAIYNTKDAGLFKGFFATYTKGTFDLEKFLVSTNWGGENWDVKIGMDSDQNYAVEGGYKISDTMTAYAGWDSGHEFLEGFDDRYEPPVFAPERRESYEFGLSITF
ncbi:hypothetical protein AQS8620_02707 [Aquimixticola soesokkakensis]|uniref:Porin domain-containing protein n=1 Tax=Aquimixticola soesokkakensis TaxID=1519096 RepID=A0A1Y5TBS9_9RHOB|nr:hypothetical protein [Aquimixticola soesokkakensis]SLN60211.1 hypothetical protein AQS8620_02707 [Aquimixticola soesokkakensis]